MYDAPPIYRHVLWGLIKHLLLLTLGWTLFRHYPQWWWAGAGLIALAGLLLIGQCYRLVVAEVHTSQQLRYEAAATTKVQGKTASLARPADPVIRYLSQQTGLLLGAFGKQLLWLNPYARGMGHLLCDAPSRTGKSTTLCIGWLMHWFGSSVVYTDIKGELTAIVYRWRKHMGHRMLVWNPFHLFGLPNHRINLLRCLTQNIRTRQGREVRDLCEYIASILLPEPPEEGPNKVFRDGGRRFLIALMLYLAVFYEPECHFLKLHDLVWADNGTLLTIARRMKMCGELRGLVRAFGNQLENMLDPNFSKTFGGFRTEALEAVKIYDRAGEWASSLETDDFTLEEVLNERTTLALLLPESKVMTHGKHLGLISTLLMETLSRAERPSKIFMLLEEAGNIGKIPPSTLTKALTLLPGKGLRLASIWQSPYQRKLLYGEELSHLMVDQSSIYITFSVRDHATAESWSKRSGTTTVKTTSYSKESLDRAYPWKPTVSERQEAVLNETEIMQMGSSEQLIWVAGQPLIRATKVPYWCVEPWRSRAAPNPYHPQGYPKEDKVQFRL